jgi:hypothetical protein
VSAAHGSERAVLSASVGWATRRLGPALDVKHSKAAVLPGGGGGGQKLLRGGDTAASIDCKPLASYSLLCDELSLDSLQHKYARARARLPLASCLCESLPPCRVAPGPSLPDPPALALARTNSYLPTHSPLPPLLPSLRARVLQLECAEVGATGSGSSGIPTCKGVRSQVASSWSYSSRRRISLECKSYWPHPSSRHMHSTLVLYNIVDRFKRLLKCELSTVVRVLELQYNL